MTNHHYYFAKQDRRLRYGDERLIEEGVTHKVDPPLSLCSHGLHASRRALDALGYAPGPVICLVELGGQIVEGGDKSCATERTYLHVFDGSELLREFARWCALQVIDHWDAPDVVRRYLETGNEKLRGDTYDATRNDAFFKSLDAVWATENAASGCRPCAGARNAAADASRSAAWGEGWAPGARSAARQKQNERLEHMIADHIEEVNND